MPTKVQIQIVTYNSRAHLGPLFAGIEKQKGVEFEVMVIDNASSDGTVEEITKHQTPNTKKITIINNQTNKGFAAGHNQGFEMCQAQYALILNPDAELQEGFLSECVNVIESDNKIASVGGVLYQDLLNRKIDSLGLKMTIYGQISDIGQNTRQKPNFSPKMEVFGITGACALYRVSALKQVKDKHGILDERFGLYSLKDDADLAWRLCNAGFKAKIAPRAIAYHARTTGKADLRKYRSDQAKQTSIRNHLMMLKKNLSLRDWQQMPFIIAYEIAKFMYVILFERQNFVAYRFLMTKIQNPKQYQNSKHKCSKQF